MEPAELRDEIPVLDDTVYLNTGACGPSPTRVVDAVTDFQRRHEYEAPAGEGMYPAAFDIFDETREAVADLLGATPGEIALTQSTTDGINRVASAIDWERGDVIVRTDVEHSSGILPWRRMRDRHGVEVRVVECEGGRVDREAFADAVAGARLVCLSALTWSHGTLLPVRELVELAHDAGALVLVDAVQLPGQRALDVGKWGADFVAAAGHKWLLGPFSAGFLSVRAGVEERLEPAHIGYRSVVDPDATDYEFEPGAPRLEVGTVSPAPYVGLMEAIEMLDELGIGTIEARIGELTARLKEGLDDGQLASPREYESGLVSFRVDDPETVISNLAANDIRIRTIPYPGLVRASIHAFNTPGDVDALLSHL